jgi:hypothetical protein
VRPHAGKNAQRQGDDDADQGGPQREEEGRFEPPFDELEDRLLRAPRDTEVALQHVAQPDAVLDDDRFIEPHLLPDFRYCLGCRLQSQHGQGWIARHQPQDDEDDDRKEQQHRDRLQQASQNVPVHHLTPVRSGNREEPEPRSATIPAGFYDAFAVSC